MENRLPDQVLNFHVNLLVEEYLFRWVHRLVGRGFGSEEGRNDDLNRKVGAMSLCVKGANREGEIGFNLVLFPQVKFQVGSPFCSETHDKGTSNDPHGCAGRTCNPLILHCSTR